MTKSKGVRLSVSWPSVKTCAKSKRRVCFSMPPCHVYLIRPLSSLWFLGFSTEATPEVAWLFIWLVMCYGPEFLPGRFSYSFANLLAFVKVRYSIYVHYRRHLDLTAWVYLETSEILHPLLQSLQGLFRETTASLASSLVMHFLGSCSNIIFREMYTMRYVFIEDAIVQYPNWHSCIFWHEVVRLILRGFGSFAVA